MNGVSSTQYSIPNTNQFFAQHQLCNPHLIALYNRVSVLERLLEDMFIERKAAYLRTMLSDYRRCHSLDANDIEYYALVLLNAITSWAVSKQVHIEQPFTFDDPNMLNMLKRTTKNDNLTLRMLAFYFAHLTLQQLQEFEVWNEPLDHHLGTRP